MSAATSPGTGLAYGLRRVCAAWGMARSSFYAMTSGQHAEQPPAKRRGPKPAISDQALLVAIEADLEASPWEGEGYRKVWARLRVCRDIRVAGQWWDLIVTMDDATSEVYSGFFVAEEGTMSTFRGLGEVIAENGLFCSLYADRASHYWHTPEAGGGVDKDNPTQVARALAQLGIELIAAYSPQARGRSERMFGTLQKRLPQELRLAGIATMAEANRFLEELFWPAHNARFAHPAADTGSAFVAFAGTLKDILCAQEDRVVAGDNTVRYKNRTLQIPADRHRHHYVKAQVRVHEYPDGHLAVFHGPRCLARYRADGETIDDDRLQAA